MSETKWTPEPWTFDDMKNTSLFTMNGDVYFQIEGRDTGERSSAANARRIVQCVNACAGMDDPEREISASHNAEMAWERAMMAAIGEDGVKSVSDAIEALKARVTELEAELAKAEAQRNGLSRTIRDIREKVAAGNNGLAPSYILNSHDFHTTINAVLDIIDEAIAKAEGE